MTTVTRTRSFIEAQFPISKLSKESYRERKANDSQTLTGLGSKVVQASLLANPLLAANDGCTTKLPQLYFLSA